MFLLQKLLLWTGWRNLWLPIQSELTVWPKIFLKKRRQEWLSFLHAGRSHVGALLWAHVRTGLWIGKEVKHTAEFKVLQLYQRWNSGKLWEELPGKGQRPFHGRKAVTRRLLVGFVGLVLQVATAGVSSVGAIALQCRQRIKIITPIIENSPLGYGWEPFDGNFCLNTHLMGVVKFSLEVCSSHNGRV